MKTLPSKDFTPHIAFFSGTFDPFTRGHESIVRRTLQLFDAVVIGIGINPDKVPMMSVANREMWIKSVFEGEDRVSVVSYSGLTVEAAQAAGATCIVRGVRNAKDFDYEQAMAEYNRNAAGIETVMLLALPGECEISSTQVRKLIAEGGDLADFLPTKCNLHLLPKKD